MKKITSMMLLASILFLFSCRNEADALQENTSKSTQTRKSISSNLISINTVRKEVKSFGKFQSSLNNSKAGKTSFDINSNNILYRKFENATTGITTYTLPINSYSSQKPYYLIQQILVSSSNVETTRYLKIIPNNPPAFKTEDVLKTLTGSIEVYDENMSYVSDTNYLNGVAQNLSSQNKPSQNVLNKTSGECDVDIITTEVLCSNGNGHHVGQTCDPGMTNDAHFEVTIVVTCPHEFGPATIGNPGSSGSGSLGGGYVFDEQLNALLTNPTFLYGDYLTSPGHELLLQIVRQWIPVNVIDINGDLSELNTRLQHFSNNDQMFNDLATYNQNTPNVPNAEMTDYSIRVYELFKFLLNNPSPENGQIASWAVSFFDQNRFVSWDEFKNTHILNAGFISYINTLPMNLKQVIYNTSNQEFLFGLNSYYSSQTNSQQAQNFINWALQYKAENADTTFQQFENWFMTESEGKDFYYDENYWEDPNLTFPIQALPSWNAFSSAYPNQTSAQMYGVVGGAVAQAQIDYPIETQNGCALKVSRALNYSGVVIPNIPGKTLKGADNKNYFLNAKALNAWMRKTFGISPNNPKHIKLTKLDGGINGKNFPNLIKNKKGIFSMVSTNPVWSSGHADILYPNGTCKAGCHLQDNPPAPIDYIDIWILN
ncbi:T6SS effector amidase Tae4 family protein [Chryseobacterium aquaticum]|uniref:Uncharacterized protein n=1 Tax=Chryseobacterium aquaticum subsp. greenlandense TaxID=345663 RepID=A0A101CJP8_9FLAO|nr:T6SS effector amidase Tae4 family protein [Chryseobacterium aquaticum]KUJ57485.1 hypothetical protein AR686_01535 [Chryseobacterium aquaticum subsp. greenlandense]